MDDAERARKAELQRAIRDRYGILGVLYAASDDGIDIDRKFGELSQILQLLVQDFQTLVRHIVRLEVIDADLQMLESCLIQRLDFLWREQVAIRNDSGDHPMMPDALNQLFD